MWRLCPIALSRCRWLWLKVMVLLSAPWSNPGKVYRRITDASYARKKSRSFSNPTANSVSDEANEIRT